MKNIEKQLKNDAKQLLPDNSVKEKIKEEAFGSQSKSRQPQKLNKKAALSFATAFAAIILIVTLTVVLVPNGGNGGGDGNQNTAAFISVDTRNTYAFGAYTAGLLIHDSGGAAVAASEINDSQVDLIGECMPVIQSLTQSQPSVVETAADRDGYAKKLTVTQGAGAYTIYYNESAQRLDDGEVKSSITGIIIIGESEYAISGKREKETDKGESEYEITVTVYYGDNNYTVFEQEIETEGGETETSYAYEIYENGVLVESLEVEFENEYGNTEVDVETMKNNQAISFEYVVSASNGYVVTVEFNDESTATVTVSVTDDEYVVTYNGNQSKSYPKK